MERMKREACQCHNQSIYECTETQLIEEGKVQSERTLTHEHTRLPDSFSPFVMVMLIATPFFFLFFFRQANRRRDSDSPGPAGSYFIDDNKNLLLG